MAGPHPGGSAAHDAHRRRPGGAAGRRAARLPARAVGAGHRRPDARPRRQQPHERPLRPRGGHRHRRLSPRPLRPSPCAVRAHQPAGAGPGRPRSQPDRRRRAGRPGRRPGLGGGRLRRRRLRPLRRLHRSAAAPEAPGSGRTHRPRRLGSAHGRRHLLRRRGAPALGGGGRFGALCPAVHERAHGQAHRQAGVGRPGGGADPARHPGRTGRPGPDPGAPRHLLPGHRGAGGRRRAAPDGPPGRSRPPSPAADLACLRTASARAAAPGLPGVASVVRAPCLPARPPGGRAVRHRPRCR